jgi:hypothetical protein
MQQVVYYKNKVCFEANLLWRNNIISFSNYKKMVIRNKIQVLHRACLSYPALVAWNSFPDEYKGDVISVLGADPARLAKRNILSQYLHFDEKACQFFADYLIDGKTRRLPEDTQREYTANAIVLNAVHIVAQNKKAFKRALSGTNLNKSVWASIAENVMELDREEYPHSLPEHWRRLMDRYKKHYSNGKLNYESLIHPNFMNKSAAKVKDEKQEAFLIKLVSHTNNLDCAQVAAVYNMTASMKGWKPITPATVGVWREKYELETHPGRRGIKDTLNNKLMQQKRSRPSLPMLFWSLDGWKAELLYQETKTDKDGHSTTTYHNRLTLVAVLDTYNNYPIGYAIGEQESPALITEALRNAVKHTEELFGKRYRSQQVQSDRYQIKVMTPIYEAVAKHVTPASVGNAKSKPVEPGFKEINKYCQLHFANWSGYGVTSKKENQPNTEHLNKIRHSFPDKEECLRQLIGTVEHFRSERVQDYMEGWKRMPEVDKLPMDTMNYLRYFGSIRLDRSKEVIENSLTGPGVVATIEGVERTYDSFDLEFRRHGSEKWILRYDHSDLSRVLATNKDGTLQFLLEEKYIQPMALYDRKPGDAEQKKRTEDYNRDVVGYITDYNVNRDKLVDTVFEETPELNDTLAKMLLTDSRGQHKDNLSRQLAIQSAQKAEVKAQRKQEQSEESDFARQRQEYLSKKVDLSKYLEMVD